MKYWPFLFFLFASGAWAQPPGHRPTKAAALLEAVQERYRSASSYQSSGKALTRIIQLETGTESSVGATFQVKLARPNLYLITWTQQFSLGTTAAGAVWNNGDSPRLYQGTKNAYVELPSDKAALALATGHSLGTSHAAPGLFFPFASGETLMENLKDVAIDGHGIKDGQPCEILTGRLDTGVEYRLWIATNPLQVVQFESTLGGAPTEHAIPTITSSQSAEALQAAGLEDTRENRQRIEEHLKKARSIMT